MSFIKIPTSPQEAKPDIIHAPKEFVSPVVDTRVTNYNTLSTFAEGSKWACDFYLLVTSRDTAPQAFTKDQLAIYGQLKLIRGFELLVTSTINPQQEGNNRGFNATGSAAVYNSITPNEGSLFIAGLGDGRNGLFVVTSVIRNSVYLESMTTIEFKQLQLLDEATLNALNNNVVETVYFDRELMRSGISPLIKQKDVNVNQRLIKAYRRLTNLYVHEFFSSRYKTLLVPRQLEDTYDPQLVKFALRVMDKTVCGDLGRVLELSANQQPLSRQKTLLDAIETVDEDLLYSVAHKSCIADIKSYKLHSYFMNIYTSGIRNIVAVYEGGYTLDTDGSGLIEIGELIDGGVKKEDIDLLLPNLTLQPNELPKVLIHPVTKDAYYIFSEAFYKDTGGQSELEDLVRLRLAHKPFDLSRLADLADKADKFDNLERFYYTPIILAMIRMAPGVL